MRTFTRSPRDLRLLAGAIFLSATGDLLALITLALLVHDLTASGIAVAGLFAATLVPVVALAPVAGVLADRVESVRLILLASIAQAIVAAALAFATDLAPLLALTALLTAGAAISSPAEFALVPAVAARDRLTDANGLVEAARYAGFAAGPLLAGALAAVGDARLALLVNAASFLAIAGAAALMRTRRTPAPPRATSGGPPDRARDGLVLLLSDRILRPTVLVAVAALALVSATLTIEVFYVKDVLQAGDAGYALLTALWTSAMVAGATALAPRVPRRLLAAGALVALGVQGAGIAGLTAWPVVPAAAIGFLVGGLGHGAKNTLIRTVIQARVPARAHGRAAAAYNAARNSAELGAVGAGGLLVTLAGPRTALMIAGLGPVLAAIGGLAWLRRGRADRTPGTAHAGLGTAAGVRSGLVGPDA